MSKEYCLLKTSYSNYYVEVWHQYPNIDKVYIGGRKKCITFSVYLDEPCPNIDGIGYHENCNKSSGTKHMVLTSFYFIYHMYKKDVFYFKDTCKILCSGYDMQLGTYYILHYGKTWYEKNFNATPRKAPDYKKDVRKLRQFLKTKPSTTEIFSDIESKSRHNAICTFRSNSVQTDLYNRSNSVQTLLQSLKEMDCIVYKGWAEQIVQTYVQYLHGIEWCIDSKSLNTIETEVISLGTNKPSDMFIIQGGASYISSMDL